jgi:23S rRNA (uridine2552-2'-O)-methyltransferase
MNGRRRTGDHYSRRARRENYPARSIYKLEHIDKRTRLIRRGDLVLDLGAAPGSWTLYASKQVGPKGLVIAIDRAPLEVGVPGNVISMEASALDVEFDMLKEHTDGRKFDAIISDMAPRTSGQKFVDQSRSFVLFSRAVEIAGQMVRPGGRFVGKIFQGEDFEVARDKVRAIFSQVKIMRPKSIRTESYEVYLVGLNRR